MTKRLYVGNVPFKATEDHLREFFSNVGEIESIRMMVAPRTGQPKGFAFLEMATDEEAKKVLAAMNGKPFMGRELRVSEARPYKPRVEQGSWRGELGAVGRTGRYAKGL
jgi:cold-inducible RNA-binding protein